MGNRRRIKNLLQKSKLCHWCGCEVVKYPLKSGQKTPDNYATIDHLYPRLHPERIVNTETTVLSCNKCNQTKNKEFYEQQIPIQVKRYLSKNHARNHNINEQEKEVIVQAVEQSNYLIIQNFLKEKETPIGSARTPETNN